MADGQFKHLTHAGSPTPSSESRRLIALVNRKRTYAGSPVQPCGTEAAFKRHKRHGEKIDAACRAAHAKELKKLRAEREARVQATEALINRHRREFDALLAAALREGAQP
jgi:acyl-CoA reductase-like NAD-dependent aldehyde dehydrogenase